jgi:hypothetical protein
MKVRRLSTFLVQASVLGHSPMIERMLLDRIQVKTLPEVKEKIEYHFYIALMDICQNDVHSEMSDDCRFPRID